MRIHKININNPDPLIIKKAAKILKSSGLVVYPTDTAYGLGGNALDEKVIRKVYEAKERDFSKPTHVIVHDWKMIKQLCYTNINAKKLYNKFLPGPLTLILKKKEVVPDTLTAKLPTLGIRIPSNLVTSKLSNLLSFPYTTPSANRSGEKTLYSIEKVKKVLDISRVNLILDAGKLSPTPPSTVVNLTSGRVKILREGPITKSEVLSSLR